MKDHLANVEILKKVSFTIPNALTLSGTINGNKNYVALESITSTQEINSGLVSYKAGIEIILEPGFHAHDESDFVAKIEQYSCDIYDLFMDDGNEKISFAQTSPKINLQNEIETKEIKLYPNPNNGSFNLETNFPLTDIAHLKITNLLGVDIYETKSLFSNTIQLPSSAHGLFFVIVILKDGTVLTQKMAVQR
jgi:hypothetical protein